MNFSAYSFRYHAFLGALAFLTALTAPRIAVALQLLLGAAALAYLLASARERILPTLRQPLVAALLALAVYLFINSTWALNTGPALAKSRDFLALTVGTLALACHVANAAREDCRAAAQGAVLALLAGLALILVEFSFGYPLLKFLYNQVFSGIFGLPKRHVFIKGGKVVSFAIYFLNRNVTNVSLLLWPALLFAAVAPGRSPFAWRAALVVLAVACAILSASGTSVAAVGVGLVVLALGHISARAVNRVVLAGWVVGLVFAVPLGALPVKLGWTSWTWLPETSAAARFYIWSYAAQKVWEKPFTGIGVRNTRELQHITPPRPGEADTESRFRPRPGRHPHNAFLQIWLELGAIGAALVLWLGVAALLGIGRLPAAQAAYGNAMFAAMCTVASFGYGIWQTWLLGGFTLAAVAYVLAVRLADVGEAEATPANAPATPGT